MGMVLFGNALNIYNKRFYVFDVFDEYFIYLILFFCSYGFENRYLLLLNFFF